MNGWNGLFHRCCGGDDRWLALTVYDEDDWGRLVGLIPALDRPEWSDVARRRGDHDEIDVLIGGWTGARQPDDAMVEPVATPKTRREARAARPVGAAPRQKSERAIEEQNSARDIFSAICPARDFGPSRGHRLSDLFL